MEESIAKIILDIKEEIYNRIKRIKLLRKYEKQVLSFKRMLNEATGSGMDETKVRMTYDSWTKMVYARFSLRYSWFTKLSEFEQDNLEDAILDWCIKNKMAPSRIVSGAGVTIEIRQPVGKEQLWFAVDIGQNLPPEYVKKTHFVKPEPYTYTTIECSRK